MKKVVTNSGDFDATVVYSFDGQKIVDPCTRRSPLRVGEKAMRSRVPGRVSKRALVMMRAKDNVGERCVYMPYAEIKVHQETAYGGERRERERPATGKASKEARVVPAICPKRASRRRTTGGYDGDGDVDADDGPARQSLPTVCTRMTGSCRIIDLDPVLDSLRGPCPPMLRIVTRSVSSVSRIHGDYDSNDTTLHTALPQGVARHPGQIATATDQPFGHQGLLYEAEIGQYQNRHHHYNPGEKRFAQRDPVGVFVRARGVSMDGLNLNGYVRGNSLAHRDPPGKWMTSCETSPGCPSNLLGCAICDSSGPDGDPCCEPHVQPRLTGPDLLFLVVASELTYWERVTCIRY